MSVRYRPHPRAALGFIITGLASTLAVCLALSCAAPARANRRDFAFTYDWWTPAKGEKEIESFSTYNTRSRNYDGAVEYETGITERFSLGGYYLYSKDRGEDLKGEGFSIESRYRFGEFQTNKVLPAGYLEYEKETGETAELEGKLLLSMYRDDPAMTNISLNLITARALEHGADQEYGYALGYARQGNSLKLRYGLEATGSLQENAHALGPVVAYDVTPALRAILSTNFALTHKADTNLRLLLEYEWF